MSHAASQYVKHLQIAPNGERLRPNEKAVLSVIADYHREEVGTAWPNMATIAACACMKTRNCRLILQELERKGVLERCPNFAKEDKSQTSNEIRFVMLDPPFDMKDKAKLAARSDLQKFERLRIPVQKPLFPPADDYRGGRQKRPSSPGRENPPPPAEETPLPRQSLAALEGSIDTSTDEANDFSPQNKTVQRADRAPSIDPDVQKRWAELYLALKSDLFSMRDDIAEARGWTQVREGQNDFDSCFRAFWLHEFKTLPGGVMVTVTAGDEEATEIGLKKYRDRLQRMVRRYLLNDAKVSVSFRLLRADGRTAAAARPIDPWSTAKDAIRRQIENQLQGQARHDAQRNYRDSIEPTRLVNVEMDGTAPVWRLWSPNPKKTRAVLSLLRRTVSTAIRNAAGGEVQLEVTDQFEPPSS